MDKVNTPGSVLLVLAVVLVGNGLLYYLYSARTPPASDDNAAIPVTPATTNGPTTQPESTSGGKEYTSEYREVGEKTDRRTDEAPRTTSGPNNGEERGQKERRQTPERNQRESDESPGRSEGIGLPKSFPECSREDEDCVRSAVDRGVSQGAVYIGGKTDLGRDDTTMYFETPSLEPCEHVRRTYPAEGSDYTVILLGKGSFAAESEEGCVP